MRMWNINPKKMCTKHLLGEHVEMHMFVSCLNKNKSIKGYIKNNLVEVHNIKKRHDEIAKEILRRKFKHLSPLKKYKKIKIGKVNKIKNIIELKIRCKRCFNL